MSLNIQIREIITPQDLDYLAANLREADKAEMKAFNGMDPREGLEYCIEGDKETWIATVEGVPCCIFGLTEILVEDDDDTKSGVIWAMGTDLLFKYKGHLNRISKKIINNWLEKYDVLFNYIWEKNEVHRQWLKRMGFIIMPETYIQSDMGEKFDMFIQFAPIDIEE